MRLVAIAALVLSTSLSPSLGAVPAASAAAPTCAGIKATIVGTAKNNTINGTKGRDVIVAGEGNDRIRGRGGNDVICAGGGADTIRGGPGNDRLYGELDAYWADAYGRVHRKGDLVIPGAGDDRVDVGEDARPVSAGVSATPDGLSFAGAPAGLVINLRANPVVTTAEGTDTLVTLASGMRIVGTRFDDTIFGTNSADAIYLGEGNDKAFGNGGDDVIHADDAQPISTEAISDTVFGNAGDDILRGRSGWDKFVGGTGRDTISTSSLLHQVIRGGGGEDTVTFPLPIESGHVVKGNSGADKLRLLANPNPLVRATVRLDQKRRKIAIRGLGGVTVTGQVAGFSDVALPGRAKSIYKGTKDSEIITANPDYRALIYGRGGSDVLIGSNEPDRLDGGKGYDIARGKGGNDTCRSVERRKSC